MRLRYENETVARKIFRQHLYELAENWKKRTSQVITKRQDIDKILTKKIMDLMEQIYYEQGIYKFKKDYQNNLYAQTVFLEVYNSQKLDITKKRNKKAKKTSLVQKPAESLSEKERIAKLERLKINKKNT